MYKDFQRCPHGPIRVLAFPEKGFMGSSHRDGGDDDLLLHATRGARCGTPTAIMVGQRVSFELADAISELSGPSRLSVCVLQKKRPATDGNPCRPEAIMMRLAMTTLKEISPGRNRPRHGLHEQPDGGCDEFR